MCELPIKRLPLNTKPTIRESATRIPALSTKLTMPESIGRSLGLLEGLQWVKGNFLSSVSLQRENTTVIIF